MDTVENNTIRWKETSKKKQQNKYSVAFSQDLKTPSVSVILIDAVVYGTFI